MFDHPLIRNPIAVSLGAIAGSLSRYYIGLWLSQRLGSAFPYGTLFVNLTGSWAMGFFITLVLERSLSLPPEVRLLIAVGFLGSFTTFSSYELDTLALWRNQAGAIAFFYWAGSAVLGMVGLYLGVWMARLGR